MSDIGLDIKLEATAAIGSLSYKATGWWAMIGIIVTESALFAYLLFTFYFVAVQPHATPWPPDGMPSLHYSLPNTIILLMSSVAVWYSERGIRKGVGWQARFALLLGLALGAIFVAIQGVEWRSQRSPLSSHLYGSLFFTITGFHMAHVVVGLVILFVVFIWCLLGYFDKGHSDPVSIGAIYWHFVDAVWLALFFTFYLSPRLG